MPLFARSTIVVSLEMSLDSCTCTSPVRESKTGSGFTEKMTRTSGPAREDLGLSCQEPLLFVLQEPGLGQGGGQARGRGGQIPPTENVTKNNKGSPLTKPESLRVGRQMKPKSAPPKLNPWSTKAPLWNHQSLIRELAWAQQKKASHMRIKFTT